MDITFSFVASVVLSGLFVMWMVFFTYVNCAGYCKYKRDEAKQYDEILKELNQKLTICPTDKVEETEGAIRYVKEQIGHSGECSLPALYTYGCGILHMYLCGTNPTVEVRFAQTLTLYAILTILCLMLWSFYELCNVLYNALFSVTNNMWLSGILCIYNKTHNANKLRLHQELNLGFRDTIAEFYH